MANYVVSSIETHLFFARIMREHALFLEAGFPCKDESWIKQADFFREEFEKLLSDVLKISEGRISDCLIESSELATQFTIPAERRTSFLTGIPIDSSISERTLAIQCGCMDESRHMESRHFLNMIHQINQRSIRLLNGLIHFKESILREVGNGSLFTANYPLLIQHILREARLYLSTIEECMRGRGTSRRRLCEIETFWNQIMMEHALFIRGLLDPSEEQLIDTADAFADNYKVLLEQARNQDFIASGGTRNDACISDRIAECNLLRQKSLDETLKYRKFKTAGADGILNNQIASIILPLLADHVLREANHYIRILTCNNTN